MRLKVQKVIWEELRKVLSSQFMFENLVGLATSGISGWRDFTKITL